MKAFQPLAVFKMRQEVGLTPCGLTRVSLGADLCVSKRHPSDAVRAAIDWRLIYSCQYIWLCVLWSVVAEQFTHVNPGYTRTALRWRFLTPAVQTSKTWLRQVVAARAGDVFSSAPLSADWVWCRLLLLTLFRHVVYGLHAKPDLPLSSRFSCSFFILSSLCVFLSAAMFLWLEPWVLVIACSAVIGAPVSLTA